MKRTLCILLALMLCLSVVPAVRADVLYEPEDDFYESHRSDCEYVNCSYTTSGPGTELTLYVSPENSGVKARVPNGESIYVAAIYTAEDGTQWGYCEYWETWDTGWAPMDYLVKIYNYADFEIEFAARIESEEGTLEGLAGQEIYVWSYPGDPTGYTVTVEAEYAPEYGSVFVDDAGRKWGYCGYYFGNKNFWVCLDDPTADYAALYAVDPPQQVTHYEAKDPAALGEIKPSGPSMGLILIAVGAVAALSGGFLWVSRKKK